MQSLRCISPLTLPEPLYRVELSISAPDKAREIPDTDNGDEYSPDRQPHPKLGPTALPTPGYTPEAGNEASTSPTAELDESLTADRPSPASPDPSANTDDAPAPNESENPIPSLAVDLSSEPFLSPSPIPQPRPRPHPSALVYPSPTLQPQRDIWPTHEPYPVPPPRVPHRIHDLPAPPSTPTLPHRLRNRHTIPLLSRRENVANTSLLSYDARARERQFHGARQSFRRNTALGAQTVPLGASDGNTRARGVGRQISLGEMEVLRLEEEGRVWAGIWEREDRAREVVRERRREMVREREEGRGEWAVEIEGELEGEGEVRRYAGEVRRGVGESARGMVMPDVPRAVVLQGRSRTAEFYTVRQGEVDGALREMRRRWERIEEDVRRARVDGDSESQSDEGEAGVRKKHGTAYCIVFVVLLFGMVLTCAIWRAIEPGNGPKS
ncbi:Hypothetical protein D9617_13g098720 [Elsinoe fawcettii]|nr:Hypothetical protein D9617_13g098720 [Elsinoe fawcettii]